LSESQRTSITNGVVADPARRTFSKWMLIFGVVLLTTEVFHVGDIILAIVGIDLDKTAWHYVFVSTPAAIGLFGYMPDLPAAMAAIAERVASIVVKIKGGNK